MRILLIIAALGLTAQPVFAVQSPSDMQTAETRRMLHAYGICVVNGQEARAAEAIVANVSNSELLRRYSRLIDGSCLPRGRAGTVLKVRFQGDQYRYALADALVRKQLASSGTLTTAGVPRLDHRDPGPPPLRVTARGKRLKERQFQDALRGHEQEQAYAYLSAYGECVVRANPAAARSLLLTEPSTPAENAGFTALQVPLGTCLPENRQLSLGKLALRGTIAVNYYRLAHAAGQFRATR